MHPRKNILNHCLVLVMSSGSWFYVSTVPGQSPLNTDFLNLNKIVRCPSDVYKRRTMPDHCHFTLSNPTKRRPGAVESMLVK